MIVELHPLSKRVSPRPDLIANTYRFQFGVSLPDAHPMQEMDAVNLIEAKLLDFMSTIPDLLNPKPKLIEMTSHDIKAGDQVTINGDTFTVSTATMHEVKP